MSTQAIELLIEKAEERAFRETSGSAMASAARAELAAIRKAAVAVTRLLRVVPQDLLQADEAEAKALCAAIAKENT